MTQALQYEVEDGMELILKFDPEDKVMKLYNAIDKEKPLEALALKNFPKKNYFPGHKGATEIARDFKEFVKKLEIGFEIEGFAFNFKCRE